MCPWACYTNIMEFTYEVYRPNVEGYSESTTVVFPHEVDSSVAIAKAEETGGWRENDWDDANENADDYRVEVSCTGTDFWLVIRS